MTVKNNKMITNLHKNRNHRIVVIKLLMKKKLKLKLSKEEIKIRDMMPYISRHFLLDSFYLCVLVNIWRKNFLKYRD